MIIELILSDISMIPLMVGIFGNLFGGGSGRKAAEAQAAANLAAIGEQRRQFNETQTNLAPFLQAGQEAIPGLVEGTTAEGFGERLRSIFSGDFFQPLVDERTRAIQGQLASTGLSRSGTALESIANIPTEIGLFLENLFTGRLGNLAGAGQAAATQQGFLGANTAGNISNLNRQTGQAVSQGILTDAQAGAAGLGQAIPIGGQLLSSLLPLLGGIGGGGAALAGPAAAIGTGGAVASLFSDSRLKKNARPIGRIGSLTLYRWEWIPQAKGTIVEHCPKQGFMANEVRELYPEFVHKMCGWDVVDYGGLLNQLESEIKRAA